MVELAEQYYLNSNISTIGMFLLFLINIILLITVVYNLINILKYKRKIVEKTAVKTSLFEGLANTEHEIIDLMKELLNLGFSNFSVAYISKAIVDRLTKYYGVNHVTLYLKEKNDGWLKTLATNIPNHQVTAVEKYYNKISENCNEEARVQITDRLGSDPLSLRGLGYSNFSFIRHRGKTIGAIVLENEEPLSVEQDARQLNIYDKVFNTTAIVLNHMLEVGDLIRKVSMDQLTGLYNRRYIDITLEEELKKHKMLDQSFYIAMLDIDHFKNFNDTYGHQFGDEVLKVVGRHLRNNVGNHSWAARYGGEEFMVVISNSHIKRVYKKIELIRNGIENLELEYEGQTASVTASFGIAGYPDNAETPLQIIAKADEALYEAKENGRNQVIVSEQNNKQLQTQTSEILFG